MCFEQSVDIKPRYSVRPAGERKKHLFLEAIKSVSGYAKSNEAEFIRQVRSVSEIQQAETAKAIKRRVVHGKKRIAELNALIKSFMRAT